MDNYLAKRSEKRIKRAWRVRKQVRGSAVKPRLSVHKTNRNLFAQIIDDENGITLASFGTMSKELRASKKSKMKPKEAARSVGQKLAELAKQKNIKAVVFDRGRFKFHGVIAELANAAREAGMQF